MYKILFDVKYNGKILEPGAKHKLSKLNKKQKQKLVDLGAIAELEVVKDNSAEKARKALEAKTVAELKEMCEKQKIKFKNNIKKDKLIDKLLEA